MDKVLSSFILADLRALPTSIPVSRSKITQKDIRLDVLLCVIRALTMFDFKYFTPTKVVFGKGKETKVAELDKAL